VPDRLASTVLDGDGDSVLWIHGYTLDSTIWGPVWAHLPGWRHIGVDLPGHGGSDELEPTETLPGLARRLFELASSHAVRHVVGLSFGGMVAIQMAIEAPGAFATLTLSSPALGDGPHDPHARARSRELARLYRERGPGPWMTERWMASPPDIFRGASTHPELWARLRKVVDRHSWSELGDGRLQGMTTHPQLRELGQIDAAVLVLVGEDDMPAFKRSAELLRVGVARCKRVYCAGAGHLSLLEIAPMICPLVDAHLRSVMPPGGAALPVPDGATEPPPQAPRRPSPS
jgi:pimeloyl-ACP methyl ester carboxylesterase